jgi:peptidoglycan/LPS O-acetylase OafA/YrhL
MSTGPIRLAAVVALFVPWEFGADFILGILGLLFIIAEYQRDNDLSRRTVTRPSVLRREKLGWLTGALAGAAVSAGRVGWQWPPFKTHPDWGFLIFMGAMIGSDILSAFRRYALSRAEQAALSLIVTASVLFIVAIIATDGRGRSVLVPCAVLFTVAAAFLSIPPWRRKGDRPGLAGLGAR